MACGMLRLWWGLVLFDWWGRMCGAVIVSTVRCVCCAEQTVCVGCTGKCAGCALPAQTRHFVHSYYIKHAKYYAFSAVSDKHPDPHSNYPVFTLLFLSLLLFVPPTCCLAAPAAATLPNGSLHVLHIFKLFASSPYSFVLSVYCVKCGLKFGFVDRINFSSENMEEQYVKVLLGNCSLGEPDLH
jgi:hypothetical protein